MENSVNIEYINPPNYMYPYDLVHLKLDGLKCTVCNHVLDACLFANTTNPTLIDYRSMVWKIYR